MHFANEFKINKFCHEETYVRKTTDAKVLGFLNWGMIKYFITYWSDCDAGSTEKKSVMFISSKIGLKTKQLIKSFEPKKLAFIGIRSFQHWVKNALCSWTWNDVIKKELILKGKWQLN